MDIVEKNLICPPENIYIETHTMIEYYVCTCMCVDLLTETEKKKRSQAAQKEGIQLYI